MHKHLSSFMTLEELGTKIPPYQPTFEFPGQYINSAHEFFSTCLTWNGLIQIRNHRGFLSIIADLLLRRNSRLATFAQIRNYFRFGGSVILGWLVREDALKLYEIAYMVSGDILELGSGFGLSTFVLSQANHDSPYEKRIFSVDIEPYCVNQTNLNLRSMGLERDVMTICDNALSSLKKFSSEEKKFDFVFIDHSHTYESVYGICRELKHIVAEGAFCLFHDFNDARNSDIDDCEYDVYKGVMDGLNKDDFDFYGIYGTCVLYRAV
jgi:SAM-dependent methyltransferase